MSLIRPRSLCILLALLATACGGGGAGGEGAVDFLQATVEVESNDLPANATPLGEDLAGTGSLLTAGDVDCWSFPAAEGEILRIDIHSIRHDQATWLASGNLNRMQLIGPNGTTVVLEHRHTGDAMQVGWGDDHWGGRLDLDVPCFLVPATGTWTLCLLQDDDTRPGGAYSFQITKLAAAVTQTETEPDGAIGGNDTPGTAEAIAPGLIRGWHTDGSNDYYSFQVSEPSIVEFEVKAYRNGIYLGDDDYMESNLTLFGTDGTTQFASASGNYFYDAILQSYIATPGTYYLRVNEDYGDGDLPYLLSFALKPTAGSLTESESNDTFGTADALPYGSTLIADFSDTDDDWFAFSGQAGDIVRLQALRSSHGEGLVATEFNELRLQLVQTDGSTVLPRDYSSGMGLYTAILRESGTHYVHVIQGAGVTGPYILRLTRFKSAPAESEPNGNAGTAGTLDANGRASGALAVPGDADWYAFSAQQGQLVTVLLYADTNKYGGDNDVDGHGSELDQVALRIRDAGGTQIAASSRQSDQDRDPVGVAETLPTVLVSFVAQATGTYYADVQATDGAGSDDHVYLLEVR